MRNFNRRKIRQESGRMKNQRQSIKALVSVISLMLFSSYAMSDDGQWTYGAGEAMSCSDWNKYRKTNPEAAAFMQSWMLGYVSAIGNHKIYDLQESDVDAMSNQIDMYCRTNASSQFKFSVDALVEKLRS
jgi:hypothetical protein